MASPRPHRFPLLRLPVLLLFSAVSLSPLGCFYEPCDEYVDYLCACHDDDPEYDCASLRRSYADAEPEAQDYCAIELDNVQEEDEANGLECEYY